MRAFSILLFATIVFLSEGAYADGRYIDIAPKSLAEIETVLDTLDQNLDEIPTDEYEPILMMLHGPEAARFLRSNYQQNQELVDLTAKLSGYGVLEVKICETWLRKNDHAHDELFRFVSTVPYGAGELRRLENEEGYLEYTFDL